MAGLTRRRGVGDQGVQQAADGDTAVNRAAKEAVTNSVPARKRGKAVQHELWKIEHMPDYLQDNEFIVTSYRRAGLTVFQSFGTFWR